MQMNENPYTATAVGGRIKALRDLKGWTQAELARKAGLSRSDVSLWEIGKQRPSPEKADKLCQALGIEMNFLVSGTTQYLQHGLAVELIGKLRVTETQN